MKEEGKYKSILVARFLWAYATDKGLEMNITKLQKLLYVLYGTYLAGTGERLVDEHIHAWPYGPVCPKVRLDFLNNDGYSYIGLDRREFEVLKKDEDFMYCVEEVIKHFGEYNATSLVNWTHNTDSPWTEATLSDGFQWNDIIKDEEIYKFFRTVWRWTKK